MRRFLIALLLTVVTFSNAEAGRNKLFHYTGGTYNRVSLVGVNAYLFEGKTVEELNAARILFNVPGYRATLLFQGIKSNYAGTTWYGRFRGQLNSQFWIAYRDNVWIGEFQTRGQTLQLTQGTVVTR